MHWRQADWMKAK